MDDSPAGQQPSTTRSPAAPQSPGGPPVLATAGTLLDRMGIELVSASADRVVATMPVAGNTQPHGLLHGGASVVLAESVGSVAADLAAGPGRVAVGVDINATHHRAVRGGTVTGVATPLHVGRSSATYAVAVTDDAGRAVCTARITCRLLDAPPR